MALQIYNTLTQRKEPFVPLRPDIVGMYVCGPTVYDYFHIGNARPFIMFDAFRRYLRYRGHQVRYVMNLTDIDDRIIQRAQESGVAAREVAAKFTQAFFEDIQKLGILPADVYPKATEHIPDMIALIARLIEQGVAYEAGGDVLFDVHSFSSYAKLSGKKLDELVAGHRVAAGEHKRSPLDFVLWKAAKPGEPAWSSPWGEGRPGWHLECSVMSMKYLGESFDIHAGGLDLIFPHHENEIAQSEAATGQPFVKYWMHNGFLDIEGEKMSKSLGNFRTARDILQKFPGTVIRMFFLLKHYRGPIDFSLESIQSAKKARERLNLAYQLLQRRLSGQTSRYDAAALSGELLQLHGSIETSRQQFIDALDDDFNTVQGMAVVFDLIRETNKWGEQRDLSEPALAVLAGAKSLFEEWNDVLGLIDQGGAEVDQSRFEHVMQLLLELRQALRQEKNFALADKIRNELKTTGIIIEDGAEGSRWRMES